jgi:hypothetical protein
LGWRWKDFSKQLINRDQIREKGKQCVEELHVVNVESQLGQVAVSMSRLLSRECQNRIAAKGTQMILKNQGSLAECSVRSDFLSDNFSGLWGDSTFVQSYGMI